MAHDRVHAVPTNRPTPPTGQKGKTHTCLECGAPYEATQRRADFCSTEHRAAFNNRRKARGAVLYDLFMAYRFERALSKKLEVWTLVCRLASVWRSEDHTERASRHSWQPPHKVLSRLTWLYAITTDIRRKVK